MNPKQTFRSIVKGRNFITPKVLKYGKTGRHIYELSDGEGFKHNIMYGITVITLEDCNWKYNTDLGKMCEDLNEATSYIKQLKNL